MPSFTRACFIVINMMPIINRNGQAHDQNIYGVVRSQLGPVPLIAPPKAADRLLAAGKKADAAKIYKHLQETRTDASEAYVKEIAGEGLVKAGG